jgi:hypothetical protein
VAKAKAKVARAKREEKSNPLTPYPTPWAQPLLLHGHYAKAGGPCLFRTPFKALNLWDMTTPCTAFWASLALLKGSSNRVCPQYSAEIYLVNLKYSADLNVFVFAVQLLLQAA